MKTKSRLTSDERDFFSLVNQAVYANPFSETRKELDVKISGLSQKVSETELIEKVIHETAVRIERLNKQRRADINLYSGRDRVLAETSFLFDFFHQFIEQFDRFILDQIEKGDTPLKVPFVREAYAYLIKKGFKEPDIGRYFELSFQLRRAYFFIYRSLIGRSPCMKELRRKLWNNVFTHDIDLYNQYLWDRMEDFSTLILGETGTGKGTAAAAIGRSGFIPFNEEQGSFVESFTQSFISLNLSQFPENLIESELFGHKKGAFTGAVEDYKGIFSRCSPFGAIFLDEIGEVSTQIQIKLLQVLQERIYSPVGSHKKYRFHGRVIAATNRSVNDIQDTGVMRDDFFYRLSSDIITVPPLRQRVQEDPGELDELLSLLVERMLGQSSPDVVMLVRDVVNQQLGADYRWPGNVRELEQCVRSVLLNRTYKGRSDSKIIDLALQVKHGIDTGTIGAQHLLSTYCFLLYQRHGTYEEVARRSKLDRRTVKKYIEKWEKEG
ncbi:MAG: sigma 54-interacting transcriptional regulator [Desulfobacterales bacterium]|nr:MAG: sigma 54-interacting transcriptional regulator [Desulfobacterales bacterium]